MKLGIFSKIFCCALAFFGMVYLFSESYFLSLCLFLCIPLYISKAKKSHKYRSDCTPAIADESEPPLSDIKSLKDTIVVVDIETTGLEVGSDRIIEISVITYERNNGKYDLIDTYSQLINPEMSIPKRATEINGIDNAMVREMPTFDLIAQTVFDKINGKMLVGYNINFDIKFISKALGRCNLITEGVTKFDVLELVKLAVPNGKTANRKLSSMADFFKIETTSHRSESDCLATFEVMQKCVEIIEDKEYFIEQRRASRIAGLNDNERAFIAELQKQLDDNDCGKDFKYNIDDKKLISFYVKDTFIGAIKLNGRKYKMELCTAFERISIDIFSFDEAIARIGSFVKKAKQV